MSPAANSDGIEPRTARGWARALRDCGVPAAVSGEAVKVPGIGRLALPGTDRSLEDAAEAFVAAETDACSDWVIARLTESMGVSDTRLEIVAEPGRVAIYFNGREIAAITRFSVTVSGKPTW